MRAKKDEQQMKIDELTADLQRMRADFENYRKRTDTEKAQFAHNAKMATTLKLLPIIDIIERAIAHVPADLAGNKWAQGVISLDKSIQKVLNEMGVTKIDASAGVQFDPNLHEAVSMDDEGGQQEVVAEELRAGYCFNEGVIRPAMVRVKK